MNRFVLLLLLCSATLQAQNGLHLVGHLDNKHGSSGYNYAGSWGYVAPDLREYAILGTATGTAIIEITDTANIHEIVHIPGPTSIWREMRTYKDRLYVVTENGGGTQIIDLSQLPDTATLVKSFTYVRGSQHTGSSHTIEIFDGVMYLNGCSGWGTTAERGVVMFSLADKDNPAFVGEYEPNYFHDSYVRNDTLFGASVYGGGGIYIADIHDKSAPVPIGKISYAGSGTHNVWTTKDGRYVISTDEIGGTAKSLKFWDLTNLPTVPTVPTSTYLFSGVGDIEHNVTVRGDYAYTAWYTAGTVVTDITDPASPATAGWYDSSDDLLYPPGSYNGVWSVYPYFWSGKIIAGDMQNGLYVFTFDSLKPRTPSSLVGPADGITLCNDTPVTFRWTRVADPVKDPHVYKLHVTGPGLDTLFQAGTDTSITLSPLALGYGTFQWSVVTKDEANAIATQDTFTLTHPWRAPIVQSPNGGEAFHADSLTAITWSSNCIDSVEILYSKNGGSTWSHVASVPALPALYNWTLPSPPTIHAKIRIRAISDTTLNDLSDAEFAIYAERFVNLNAPNGGEVWQSGTYHQLTWVSGLVTHVSLHYSTDGGASWTTVVADTPASVASAAWLVPNVNTTAALVRITDLDNPSVTDTSDAVFTIWPTIMDFAAGWNLVSFPGIPSDPSPPANFTGASSGLFFYDTGYQLEDSITTGVGYWVKYAAPASIPLNGSPVGSTTIGVNARWNMIGAVSVPVAVASLTPDPPTMTLSTIYGYTPGGGYAPTDSLYPGQGYWVKASESGELTIYGGPIARNIPVRPVTESDEILFTDATGSARTIAVGAEGEELPPPPPVGSFDVRFASQRSSEAVGAVIELRGGTYPVTIRSSGRLGGRYRIVERIHGMERAGYPLNLGDVVISAKPAGVLSVELVSASSAPRAFRLEQNWPNPFNPVTTITFDLATETRVSLKVYNLLGSEVATLIAGVESAGSHRVDFNAADLPSGVYLCKLRTEAGTEMRKMLLAR